MDQLFNFAFFPHYEHVIENLASLASKEDWDFSDSTKKTHAILKGYLEHTYRKLLAERKIIYTQDNVHACFHTGLITDSLEDIYAVFEKKRIPNQQPFCFKAFLKRSDARYISLFADKEPLRADFFSKPEDIIFNPNLNVIPQIDHIVEDNVDRFPIDLQKLPKNELIKRVDASIQETIKLAKTNYQIAVPQCFNGKIQLLLPLYLTAGSPNPDLCLAITRVETIYTARTCLTMRMAYGNARLIVKPQSSWLKV